ncbi:MAG: hypothetical protein AAF790_12455 [Planctomycetota bacterium]
MNFDNTHIAIRERGFAEVMDLALHVTRRHCGPLLLCLLAGATPWAVANGLLLYPMVEDVDWEGPIPYAMMVLLLAAVEAPLATAPMTLYLGQVTFANEVSVGRIVRDFFRSVPQMLWSQGILRALCAPLVVPLLLPYVVWPYLSELILLERNPVFPGKQKAMTTRRRSKHLHSASAGELFTRWLVSLVVGALMVTAFTGAAFTVAATVFDLQPSGIVGLTVIMPASLWLVIGFFAVVRFLAYLDLRIRREGWEVELTMRAEAERLARLA